MRSSIGIPGSTEFARPALAPAGKGGTAPTAARRNRARLALAALVALLGGCRENEVSYFPLDDGWTWGYRVTIDTPGTGKIERRSYVSNLAPQILGNATTVPRIFHDGRVYYYAEQPDGVRRLEHGGPGEAAAPAPPGRYVLKRPIEVGTKWRQRNRTYLLRKHFFSDETVPVGLEFDYVIEKTDDVVTVPAGTFTRCVRLRGGGTTMYELSPLIGNVRVEVETLEWFAPGVGLVKMVRRETTYPQNPGSGELVMELEALDKRSWFD